jgi:hypothetical protein
MHSITDFKSFYQTTLQPNLVELETSRKAIASKIKLYGLMGIGIGSGVYGI